MAKQTINLGMTANDGTGDDLRTGGDKINDNFTELYDGAVLPQTKMITIVPTTGAEADTNVGFEVEVRDDPNAGVGYSALYVSAKVNGHRVYFGDAASNVYLNFSNVGSLENVPASTIGGITFGGNNNTCVRYNTVGNIIEYNNANDSADERRYVWFVGAAYGLIGDAESVEGMRLTKDKRLIVQNSVKCKVRTSASDPTTSDIADGFMEPWHNTTSGVTSHWVNIGGTMKSSEFLP